MTDRLKLMAVLAHPDDESFGFGGILAKYAAENIVSIPTGSGRNLHYSAGQRRLRSLPPGYLRVPDTSLDSSHFLLGLTCKL